MELKDLMSAFADDFGLRETQPDEFGAYEFTIDDFRLSFSVTADGRSMLILSPVADLPETGRERLLGAILESFSSRDAVCTLEPGRDRLFLQRLDPIDGLDLGRFKANLESFVIKARSWRRLISSYNDAVAGARAESRGREGERT